MKIGWIYKRRRVEVNPKLGSLNYFNGIIKICDNECSECEWLIICVREGTCVKYELKWRFHINLGLIELEVELSLKSQSLVEFDRIVELNKGEV